MTDVVYPGFFRIGAILSCGGFFLAVANLSKIDDFLNPPAFKR
ncbi:hypothetical protein [Enterobacter sp. UNJFSC 003]|nr:hypothetical protein [Serratia liquefaciens]